MFLDNEKCGFTADELDYTDYCIHNTDCSTQYTTLPLPRLAEHDDVSSYREDVITSSLLWCSCRDVGQFKSEH